MSLLKGLFGKLRSTPAFNHAEQVQKYVDALPPCAQYVVIASPKYGDEHYKCDVTVHVERLLAWAAEHAQNVFSGDDYNQAAREALPIWLSRADKQRKAASFMSAPLANVVRDYVSNFIDKADTHVFCPECRGYEQNIRKADFDHKANGNWRSWTSEWHCQNNHLLYRQHHKIRYFFNPEPPEEELEPPERRELRVEFETVTDALMEADLAVQVAVGTGINLANSLFTKEFRTVAEFSRLSKSIKVDYVNRLTVAEKRLKDERGDFHASLGFGLFKGWLGAITEDDEDLVDNFGARLNTLSRIADGSR